MNEAEVRERVMNYLIGRSTLRELDESLAPIAWDPDEVETVRVLANAVELRLDEYSSGHCDEQQLRAALRPLVTVYTVFIPIGPAPSVQVSTSASSAFVPSAQVVTVTPTFAGTRPAVVLL